MKDRHERHDAEAQAPARMSRWYDCSRARDAMFAATDTAWAPWYVADADDKKRARLNVISQLLSQVPCKPLPLRHIPTPF